MVDRSPWFPTINQTSTGPVTKKPLNPGYTGRTRTVLPALPVNLCEFALLPHVRTRTVRVFLRVKPRVESLQSLPFVTLITRTTDERPTSTRPVRKKRPLSTGISTASQAPHIPCNCPRRTTSTITVACAKIIRLLVFPASVPPRQVSVDEFPTKSPHRALRPSSSDTTPNN